MKFMLRAPLCAILCGSVLFWAVGCEDRPDTENIGSYFQGMDLSPDNVKQSDFAQRADPLFPGQDELVIGPAGDLTVQEDGQIVEVTLQGADGSVSWSVAFGDKGELITKSALGATYRRKSGGDNVVSATDQSGRSVAKVIKQPVPPPPAPADPAPLVIAGPTDPIVLDEDGMIAGISLSGAIGNVTWSVSYSSRGRIVAGTASSTGATYRRDSSGDNVVTATDDAGRMVNVIIRQP